MMPNLLQKPFNILLYADDMNLLCNHKCLKKATAVLNKELSSLSDWFQANKLTVNLTKTKHILFGTQQRLKNIAADGIEGQLSVT